MESQVLRPFGKTSNKKTLRFHLELNFNNFQERKNGNVLVDCYNILTIEIDITGFHIKTINESIFTIILYFILLYVLLEDEH